MKYSLLIGTFVLSSLFSVSAQQNNETPTAGAKQYDFLIGNWDIKYQKHYVPAGGVKYQATATQHAYYKDSGKMLVDEWVGFSPDTVEQEIYGVTLRTYSSETGNWQNVHLMSNQSQPTSSFTSHWENNEIHGRGSYEVPGMGTIDYKLRFFDITDSSFKWEQHLSRDGGKTWFLDLTQNANRVDK